MREETKPMSASTGPRTTAKTYLTMTGTRGVSVRVEGTDSEAVPSVLVTRRPSGVWEAWHADQTRATFSGSFRQCIRTARRMALERHAPVRGHLATIIAGPTHCPRDGISSYAKEVIILTEDGAGRYPVTPERPAVRLVTRPAGHLWNANPWSHFVPVAPRPDGRTGYRFGGAYVAVTASIANSVGLTPAAYSLHDVIE